MLKKKLNSTLNDEINLFDVEGEEYTVSGTEDPADDVNFNNELSKIEDHDLLLSDDIFELSALNDIV